MESNDKLNSKVKVEVEVEVGVELGYWVSKAVMDGKS